ncbi:DUF2189 domain-containing protein [Limnohabitans sp.]|jgi:uncharacterized membrane protein|uniref:DUF2189 domain-containing protein n=1 Tax=Limnohabitans sp. TaxID=1907725 RepID=UPI0037C10D55
MTRPQHTLPTQNAHALAPIKPLLKSQVFKWLILGFKDVLHAPGLSLLHGWVLALLGAGITWFAHDRFWLLAGALSGFLVVAPVLATSLYAMSRAIERGDRADMALLINTWTQWQMRLRHDVDSYWSLIRFGLLLGLAATGWVITSAALITLLSPQPIHTPLDFVHHVVLAKQGYLFEIWTGLGAVLALPMFASSVIAMPLLLDRRVTVLQAVLTSWQAVLTHPFQMLLWAFLISLLSVVGMGTVFLGLVVIVPVLGHASWHAYRDMVDTSDLEERLPRQARP